MDGMKSLDRGELLKSEFTVIPGNNGTFVIRARGELGPGSFPWMYGFTTIDDLLSFLLDESVGLKASLSSEAQEKKPWAGAGP